MSDVRVVVVDDVAANVELLRAVLANAGFDDVACVTDARRVIEECERFNPDLVLLDLHMPHVDGIEVLRSIRETFRGPSEFLPVVMLTADVSPAVRNQALEAGATDFLTKPFDAAEVVLRVRNLLRTRELYQQLEFHNAELERELSARRQHDELLARQYETKRGRVLDVLGGDVLRMVFQPIVEISSGHLVGVEALARFDHALSRPPDWWFREADDVGLGVPLELEAIDRAFRQFPELAPGVFMSVNASPATAVHPELAEMVQVVPGDRLVVEITEHSRVESYATVAESLRTLCERGIRTAVDDAGSGYAGLHHILQLRPDIVKLDRDLVSRIDSDPAKRALAHAMVRFADEIDAVVIAEGIETEEELSALRDVGVPWGQGYVLAPPGSFAELKQRFPHSVARS